MKSFKFNINDSIKTKLTSDGITAFESHYWQLARSYGLDRDKLPKLPKPDKNGYYEFQLWDFMRIFGEKMYMGGPVLIESGNIIIEEDRLEKIK